MPSPLNRYVLTYTVAALLVTAVQATSASAQGTTLIDNTVCVNLITFLLAVLLPAREFTEILTSVVYRVVPRPMDEPTRSDAEDRRER